MQVRANSNGRWLQLEIARPVIGTYTVEALVFEEPSEEYGINGGRISKLWIRLGDTVVYNYDRGLDYTDISAAELALIIKACESIDQTKLTRKQQIIELSLS